MVRTCVEDRVPGSETTARLGTGTVAAGTDGATTPNVETVVVIDRRELFRECLASCIAMATGRKVLSSSEIESWLGASEVVQSCLVIYCCPGELTTSLDATELVRLAQLMKRMPVVILSDREDLGPVVDAIARGARGYIPTSLKLAIVNEALRLIEAGGIFIPAASVMAARQESQVPNLTVEGSGRPSLTPRQKAVIARIGKGKANKVIAQELNMRENTVKVHVRRIMEKLKAKNRTEVALIANELLGGAPVNR